MPKTYAIPQPLTGAETVSVHQVQNGHLVKCTTTLAELVALAGTPSLSSAFAALPTSLPASAGVVWNNHGVISIS